MKEKDTASNLVSAANSLDAVANVEPVRPAMETVLDTERQKDADILLLRNGDKLTGTVVNEKFSITTSYAHLDVVTKHIAGMNLEGGANNIESIIAENNNRFSGFIDDSFISFKLTNGPQLEIRREKVLKIVLRQRSQDMGEMKWTPFIWLKNGDYFHGQILTKDIILSTIYAKIPLDFATTESITLIGESNPLLTIVKMTNGDSVHGILEIEDIQIELDAGSVIEVYQDRIDRIFFKEGHVSAVATKNHFALVEKGSFTMGNTWGDGKSNEKPTHKVTLTYDFYIGKYEVTFNEYNAFCEATGRSKNSDDGWGGGIRPATYVEWFDAIEYCNWLSEMEGLLKAYDSEGNFLDKDGRVTTDPSKVVGYRLPTEAEWEYAARGGNKSRGYKYSGSDNVDDVSWCRRNSGDEYLDENDIDKFIGNKCKIQKVGKKAPNELGLYDMSGNVEEWCSDFHSSYSCSPKTNPYNSTNSSNRVIRGGSYQSHASETTVASRSYCNPTHRGGFIGFRICKTL
ncbi:formylglycine-generating enzyme family protein [Mesotoga prima]|uniref:formylglycine-generating enzyme family protein n=2 Tax=Mesotoga prima TaxID=1184387 RepID=UPI002CFC688B|nr:formylglycine-generating enzyme family protein [Mesotoga prima]HNQ71376.1 formylglycine-generating enzyme family protein [Mesotoga prima]